VRIGLGGKLFIAWLCAIGIAALTADLFLERASDAYVTEQIRSDLVVRARAAAKEASNHPFTADDTAQWDAVADDEGKILDARVTFIRKDGAVVGDSEVAADGIATLENHASRPEVGDALHGKMGSSVRQSATIGIPLLYVAIPVEGVGPIAVVRVAQPMAAVEATISQVHAIIGGAAVFALAVAAILSAFVARRVSGSLRDLTEAARKMAKGDLTARTNVRGKDELGELGEALDTIAANLGAAKSE
jgi:two-component system phosphate regulon sensor histidine kinase PhoR